MGRTDQAADVTDDVDPDLAKSARARQRRHEAQDDASERMDPESARVAAEEEANEELSPDRNPQALKRRADNDGRV